MDKKTETRFTLPGLARRLGLQSYQIEYLVRTGRIPDAALRTASNCKAWAAQAEAIERWYRDYKRIVAGCCAEIRQLGKDVPVVPR